MVKFLEHSEVRFVAHLSDIHIPLGLRESGRMEAFEDTFTMLNKTLQKIPRVDIIVVTGDILDTKYRLEPDTVLLGRRFFQMLAQIAPTFVIAGNHDILETNLEQTCTLSVIVDGLDNVHYLSHSGVYQIGSQNLFAVSSLKDAKFIHRADVGDTDKRVIALYHGTLAGSKTDNGRILGRNITTSSSRYRLPADFNGFDFVMLGDIHKQQSIGPTGTMAYAGSLLQLNIGESLDDHGFLLWDLGHLETPYTFHRIKTDHGFIRLKIEKGQIVESDLPTNIPAKPVIVCRVLDLTTPAQLEVCKRKIEERYRPKRLRIESGIGANTNDPQTPSSDGGEVKRAAPLVKHDRPSDEELIRKLSPAEHHTRLLQLHTEVKERVASYASVVPTKDVGVTWTVKSLAFENIFVYGKSIQNKIVFNPGVTNISAPNRYGKSSIWNMIMFALYDRCAGGHNHVLNKNETNGYVTLIIEHGNDELEITKHISRRTGKQAACDLCRTTFRNITTGINLTGGNVTDTNSVIQKYIGRVEDFNTDNILGIRTPSIIEMTPTERLRYMQRLFGTDQYQAYANCAKLTSKALVAECAELRGQYRAFGEQLVREFGTGTQQFDILSMENRVSTLVAENDTLVKALYAIQSSLVLARTEMNKWASAEKYAHAISSTDIKKHDIDQDWIRIADDAYSEIKTITNRQQTLPSPTIVLTNVTEMDLVDTNRQFHGANDEIGKIDAILGSLPKLTDDATDQRQLDDIHKKYGSLNPPVCILSDVERRTMNDLRQSILAEFCVAQKASTNDAIMADIASVFLDGKDGIVRSNVSTTSLTKPIHVWIGYLSSTLPEKAELISIDDLNSLTSEYSRVHIQEQRLTDLEAKVFAWKRELKSHGYAIEKIYDTVNRSVNEICLSLQSLPQIRTDALELSTSLRDDALMAIHDQTFIRLRREYTDAKKELEQARKTISPYQPSAATINEIMMRLKGRCELISEWKRLRAVTPEHRQERLVAEEITNIEMRLAASDTLSVLADNAARKTENNEKRKAFVAQREILDQTCKTAKLNACNIESSLLKLKHQKQISIFKQAAGQALFEYNCARTNVAAIEKTEAETLTSLKTVQDALLSQQCALQCEQDRAKRYATLSTSSASVHTRLVEKEQDAALYALYVSLMEPKGLPLQLLQTYTGIAADRINEILQVYTQYRISLQPRAGGTSRTGATHDELELEILYCGETPILASRLSGAESAVLSTAVKAVCARLRASMSGSTTSSLVIADEAFDCVDKSSWCTVLETVFDVLRTTYRNILFISHRNVPSTIVENDIRIVNNGETSHIA